MGKCPVPKLYGSHWGWNCGLTIDMCTKKAESFLTLPLSVSLPMGPIAFHLGFFISRKVLPLLADVSILVFFYLDSTDA